MTYSLFPLQPVTPIVTPQNLADFMALNDADDPALSVVAASATEAIINYVGYEFISRRRRAIYRELPAIGTNITGNLTGGSREVQNPFALPFSGLIIEVLDFKLYGENITDKIEIQEGRPALIHYPRNIALKRGINAIDVTYNTGSYNAIDEIPADLTQAALLLAGFIYDHRGCDNSEAIMLSGSGALFNKYVIDRILF